jgi:hypothetical protein
VDYAVDVTATIKTNVTLDPSPIADQSLDYTTGALFPAKH